MKTKKTNTEIANDLLNKIKYNNVDSIVREDHNDLLSLDEIRILGYLRDNIIWFELMYENPDSGKKLITDNEYHMINKVRNSRINNIELNSWEINKYYSVSNS